MEQYKNHHDDYHALLKIAGAFHGDICSGIEIGTRMTMCGLKRLGISDPTGKDRKKLIVFVEIDRCATDAIMALTGCQLGKRTLKIRDYGKMAATFINLETNQAVRVAAAIERSPDGELPDLVNTPEHELFRISEVKVFLRPEDLPGRPVRLTACSRCGEEVLDGREVVEDGKPFCRSCFEQATYYQIGQAECR